MLKGTIYLTIRQIVFIISTLILHIYLGRTLGPELYGIFGLISAFLIVNDFLLFKAVFETISKFVAEGEEATGAIIKSSLKVSVIVCLVLGAMYFVFARQLTSIMNDPELTIYIRLCAFIIPIAGISTVFLGTLNGLRQFGRQALISIVFSVVRLIAIFILVFLGFSLKGVVIGFIIAELFQLVIARWLLKPLNADADFDRKKMFGFGLQLFATGFIAALIMNIDLFAVKVIMQDNFQTGLYTSAVTISKIWIFFVYPIALTALPTISKSISDRDMILTEHYIKQSMRLLLISLLPISLLCMTTSENLLSLFYGSRYIEASTPLKILIFGSILLSIKMVMFNVIMASGLPRYIIYIGLLSLLIEIVLIISLVDKIGLMGAALASTITHFVGLVLSYYYVAKKFMTHSIPISFIRIILASLVIYLIAAIYSPSGIMLLFYYAILMCLFFSILAIVKEINLAEIKVKFGETWMMFRSKDIAARYLKRKDY